MAFEAIGMDEATKRHHIMRRKESLGLNTEKLQHLGVK